MIGDAIEYLASPSPPWLTQALIWTSLAAIVVIGIAKTLTVVLLSLIRDKLPLDKATIFNQTALLQVVGLALLSNTVFRDVGLEDRPTWAQIWWLGSWSLVAVSGVIFVWNVWLERVRPMWWEVRSRWRSRLRRGWRRVRRSARVRPMWWDRFGGRR